MPQMMPMMWLYINIFIFFILYMKMSLMYFLFMNYNNLFKLIYINKLNLITTWKWKW